MGGFFNVPREVLPQADQGLKLFDIQPESVANAPADKPVQAPAYAPRPIKLDLPPGADVAQAWEDFFAKHEPDPAKLKQMDPAELKAYRAKLVPQQQSVLLTVQELKQGR